MPENREQKSIGSDTGSDAARADQVAPQNAGSEAASTGDLDLEGLDLTVETVEERISPSETNVFDK